MLKILRRFYGFLLQKRLWAVFFAVLSISAPFVESLNPYFYKLFVDAIPTLNFQTLFNILILFIGLKFVNMFLNIARFFVFDLLFLDGNIRAQESVFKHIHDLDFAFHTNKSSGSLISAIKRGESSFWNLDFSLHLRIFDTIVKFFVMLYFFGSVDIRILWLVVLSFVLGIVVTIIFVHFNIKARKMVNENEDKISSIVVDNMINFETVKLFAKESWEQERFREKYTDWKRSVWKYAYTFRSLDFAMGIIINASIFAILLYTLNLTIAQQIGIGDFVLVATFLQSFYPQLFELIWGIRDIAKSYADIQKFFGILDNEIRIKDPQKPLPLKNINGEINLDNISFSYGESKTKALVNIDFKIRPGQSIALVGRSGAGKTTLAKLLLRFYDVDHGAITIDGIDIKDIKKSDLRSLFGVVPQEPVLFNNTVAYNIAYGKEHASRKEIVAAAKMANIHSLIETLPQKYETQVGERGIKLSGGQKQRLAIARMILSDPEIIIFDEATSQLDSESEKLIQEAFWKAARNKTTIVIAHRLSTIKKVDKIIVLEDGKIVEVGTHADLVNKKDSLYNHFWSLQVRD